MTLQVRVHQGRLEARGVLPEDRERLALLRNLWEERAAILEYQAGFTQAEAEQKALEEILPGLEKGAA